MKQMTFLDLCSGIGGFRLGLETAGHKCIGYCEYDKFARASYEAMYDTEGEWKAHDVTKLKPGDVPYADIWCFGVPQNRERVFIIANLRSRGRREILPLTGENAAALNQLIGGMQGYRVYGTDGISATLVGNAGGVGAKTGLYFIDQSNHDPKITDTARCLTARYTAGMTNHTAMNSAVLEVHPVLTPERMEKRQNGRRMKEDGEPMFTLTSQDRHGVYVCEKVDSVKVKNATKAGYEVAREGDGINLAYPDSETRRGRVGKGCSQTLDCSGQMGTLIRGGRIRRLTPRECFRLQGFSDELFDRASAVNSDAQLYKQAGNAVTATVAYAVAMSLPESRS